MKKLFRYFLPLFIIAILFGQAIAADKISVPLVYERYKYVNVTTATTTLVKTGLGILAGITVNGGTLGAITVYDNTAAAGPKIATIAVSYAGQVIPFGVGFTTGLTVVTGAATDITVIYW